VHGSDGFFEEFLEGFADLSASLIGAKRINWAALQELDVLEVFAEAGDSEIYQ
jgi:hypothetical protein